MTTKTRFCPSPTGRIHLGNARTALFNALFSHSESGIFLLRIEDTDKERSNKAFADAMMSDLDWMGCSWDEGAEKGGDAGPYWQSERQGIYDKYYATLIEQGLAYPCFCSEQQLAMARKAQRASGQPPRYPGTCRHLTASEVQAKREGGLKPTLRFRIPDNDVVTFTDLVHGEQRFETNDIGDFIIRRTDGTSPFMYCNAIDDALMGVSHAFRGEDHLTNTPRQLLILRALKLLEPQYGHISLILGADGAPLSKRNGSRSIEDLRNDGYLPQAVFNYLARLGHYFEDNALMTLPELAKQFDVKHLGKSPSRFDATQLLHWQKLSVQALSDDAFKQWLGDGLDKLVPKDKLDLFIETIRPNVHFPKEAVMWADKLFGACALDDGEKAVVESAGKPYFEAAIEALKEESKDYKVFVNKLKEKSGCKGKALFQPLRVALTGALHGPEMPGVFALLGEKEIEKRFIRQIKAEKKKPLFLSKDKKNDDDANHPRPMERE